MYDSSTATTSRHSAAPCIQDAWLMRRASCALLQQVSLFSLRTSFGNGLHSRINEAGFRCSAGLAGAVDLANAAKRAQARQDQKIRELRQQAQDAGQAAKVGVSCQLVPAHASPGQPPPAPQGRQLQAAGTAVGPSALHQMAQRTGDTALGARLLQLHSTGQAIGRPGFGLPAHGQQPSALGSAPCGGGAAGVSVPTSPAVAPFTGPTGAPKTAPAPEALLPPLRPPRAPLHGQSPVEPGGQQRSGSGAAALGGRGGQAAAQPIHAGQAPTSGHRPLGLAAAAELQRAASQAAMLGPASVQKGLVRGRKAWSRAAPTGQPVPLATAARAGVPRRSALDEMYWRMSGGSDSRMAQHPGGISRGFQAEEQPMELGGTDVPVQDSSMATSSGRRPETLPDELPEALPPVGLATLLQVEVANFSGQAVPVAVQPATTSYTEPLVPAPMQRPLASPAEQPEEAAGADAAGVVQRLTQPPEGVRIVDTAAGARQVVDRLLELSKDIDVHLEPRYFACDTEVAHIDVKTQTPVGHGIVTCFSIYCGPDAEFHADSFGQAASGASASSSSGGGTHPSTQELVALARERALKPAKQAALWIDVWDEVVLDPETKLPIKERVVGPDGRWRWQFKLKPHHPIIDAFREFFEDPSILKVWHNYSFDRHVLANMGIECQGFGADTLHMARLHDASRRGKRNYSLESLTADDEVMKKASKQKAPTAKQHSGQVAPPAPSAQRMSAAAGGAKAKPLSLRQLMGDPVKKKVPMKKLFGEANIRTDGSAGKLVATPPVEELQTNLKYRYDWIEYSAMDAKATWQLRLALQVKLQNKAWIIEDHLAKGLGQLPNAGPPLVQAKAGGAAAGPLRQYTLWDFYKIYWRPFGEVLSSMEKEGIMVNREHLRNAQVQAEQDKERNIRMFLEWAASLVPHARYMNTGSGAQIRQLLFPDYPGDIARGPKKATLEDGSPAPLSKVQLKAAELAEQGCRLFKAENPDYEAEKAAGGRPKKYIDVVLHSIWGKGTKGRLEPEKLTPTGAAAVSMAVLRTLCGGEGKARKALAELQEQKAAAAAEMADQAQAAAAAATAALPTAAEGGAQPSIQAGASDAGAAVPCSSTLHQAQAAEVAGKLPMAAAPDGATGAAGAADHSPAEVLLAAAAATAQQVAAKQREVAAAAAVAAAVTPMLPDEAEHIFYEQANLDHSPLVPEPLPSPAEDDPDNEADFAQPQCVKVNTPEEEVALEAEAKALKVGKLYVAMGGKEAGLKACVAVEALCEANAIAKLLDGFIIPLQSDDISSEVAKDKFRIHCSLNINTETGRLSCRRPNLQNQPAQYKDRYKVRKAFTADPGEPHTPEEKAAAAAAAATSGGEVAGGNGPTAKQPPLPPRPGQKAFVVADYGQLELRLLAHIAGCKSMLDAFELGGDFHSRTAFDMYDYIKEAVNSGVCLIESTPENDAKPEAERLPTISSKFKMERGRAKGLNFSIAYGKTAFGLAKDFGVSQEEAQDIVDRWYGSRSEVLEWQNGTRSEACHAPQPFVRTLLGRTRPLPDITSLDRMRAGHASRAAINTPVQGSAADVAATAMVTIARLPWFKENGWKLIMQIHDEVILEGPHETREEAKRHVEECMSNPWHLPWWHPSDFYGGTSERGLKDRPLLPKLEVDAKYNSNWFDAK